MKKIEISRTRVEIATEEIKLILSPTTGFLESIISVPFNFDWIGKPSLPVQIKIDKRDAFQNITDIYFVEIYEEDSANILQTIVGKDGRLNIKFTIFSDLPVIIIDSELLVTENLMTNIAYYPLQFELNNNIQTTKLELKTLIKKHHYASFANQLALCFFHDVESSIDIVNSKRVVIIPKFTFSLENGRKIKLPFSYISSPPIKESYSIDCLHSKVVNKYQSHLRRLKDKQY
ncbi:MAG: hypothetical protein N3G21_06480 [Candidatus Hydrogenedentes bacterium]|nr:hypothetical protein [Candidatus Hydrogenedentota bacterium]